MKQADIDAAADILAADNRKIKLVIHFKGDLYEQAVWMHRLPKAGMRLTAGRFRFQVSEVYECRPGWVVCCNRLTRKRFDPSVEGWTKALTLSNDAL